MNGKPFSSQYAVHPHLRGAYAALPRQQLIFPGSSPHTWGIHRAAGPATCCERFIPTYVGHTIIHRGPIIGPPVHPHIRGAYHRARNGVAHVARFIPTYVGYTFVAAPVFTAAAVHPHIRGVYTAAGRYNPGDGGSSPHTWGIRPSVGRSWNTDGSSPHTWGILKAPPCWRTIERFIPTYVGYTLPGLHAAPSSSVHPHIRGVYTEPP